MSIIRISDNVYSVGVLNPSLRTFDIVMQTKFGTSYNAYMIVDGNKTVLIDTVHSDYFDEYIYNVQCLAEISDIDYIVMNHTELDHSGSLKNLIDMNPNITVVCTAAAQKYLRQILNQDFKCQIIKHGDLLNLPTLELQFVVAPFLHWPDSMMTYLKSDNTLFSCDVLGCHFCEPTMLDENIRYEQEYLNEFKNYYDGIFGPFKKYVISGLDKISNLDIDYVCPSHGPVLCKEINQRIDDYRNWSLETEEKEKQVTIVYASSYGCTKELADRIFEKISKCEGVSVDLFDLTACDIENVIKSVERSKYLFVGSCTINRDAPKVIWDVLSSVSAINSRGKLAGVFGSYGWSGEAVGMIVNRLTGLGYKVAGEGVRVNFKPTSDDLVLIENYASELVSLK